MREIKFRAWDKDRNLMIKAEDICRLHFNHGVPYGILTWNQEMILKFDLMQFTGLHDKNGKEIWEGDIVESMDDYHNYISQIIYDAPRTAAFIIADEYDIVYLNHIHGQRLRVIGNIYENPELIEGALNG